MLLLYQTLAAVTKSMRDKATTHFGKTYLSIVVPCYDEEQSLQELYRRVTAAADGVCGRDYELILVDDGSRDQTWKTIYDLSAEDPNVVAIRLARNHGHQLALTAGLSAVRGDVVLAFDADLQDPPELLKPMHDMLLSESADVVYGLRRSRAGESQFKTKSAKVFYRLLASLTQVDIPPDTGDFRLMTRRFSDQVSQMPERDRFIRGMVAWLGYKQVAFEYDRDARFAGTIKYSLRKMLGYSVDAVISFSMVPLRIATYVGAFLTVALAFIGIGAVISRVYSGTCRLDQLDQLDIACCNDLCNATPGAWVDRRIRRTDIYISSRSAVRFFDISVSSVGSIA